MPIKVDPNANYMEYGMTFLPWQDKLLTVACRMVLEDGLYRIVFQCQVVNNTAKWGPKTPVMVTAKLFVDGQKVKIWTENILPGRHYGMPTLVKDMQLNRGQTVEVKMRSDCSKPFHPQSVFVLMADDRFQFDVTKG